MRSLNCASNLRSFARWRRLARPHSAQKLIAPAKILGPQYGIPGLKYTLDRLGYYGGPARPPLLPLSASAKLQIDAMLSAVVPESSIARSN